MSSSSDTDPELEDFLENVLEDNEDKIRDIIEWELEQARDIFDDLPDDQKGQAVLGLPDILPKVDDIVRELLDRWLDDGDSDSDSSDGGIDDLDDIDIDDLR